jgi:hypothetical protein
MLEEASGARVEATLFEVGHVCFEGNFLGGDSVLVSKSTQLERTMTFPTAWSDSEYLRLSSSSP